MHQLSTISNNLSTIIILLIYFRPNMTEMDIHVSSFIVLTKQDKMFSGGKTQLESLQNDLSHPTLHNS